MGGRQASIVVDVEHGEVDDPEKRQLIMILRLSQVEAKLPEHRACLLGLVGDEQQQVAGSSIERLDDAILLPIGQELGDRGSQTFFFHHEGNETLGSQITSPIGQCIATCRHRPH